MTRGVHDSTNPSRPVRRPGATEYDLCVARDLSRGPFHVDWNKAKRLPFLPLFFVAVDGHDGIEAAKSAERQRMAA